MGSVKSITTGRSKATLSVSDNGTRSSSSSVLYLSSPVSLRSFAALRRRITGARVSGMNSVKAKHTPEKINRTQSGGTVLEIDQTRKEFKPTNPAPTSAFANPSSEKRTDAWTHAVHREVSWKDTAAQERTYKMVNEKIAIGMPRSSTLQISATLDG